MPTFDERRALLPSQKVDHLGSLAIPLHGLHAMGLRYGENQFAQKSSCMAAFALAIGIDVESRILTGPGK